MVLLCPCIYCTVDKNSKLEVSSGLHFFNFDFFDRIGKYLYQRVLLGRESIKIPLQIFSGFNLLAALEAFQSLLPNPNNNICMFIL